MPVFLRVQRLRRTLASEARGLLRVLLLRVGPVSTNPAGGRGVTNVARCGRSGSPESLELTFERRMKHGSRSKKKIEIFTAGCATCNETVDLVKRIAGANHDIEIHDMHQAHIAARAKQHGIRSLPSIVVDGQLAGCCAGRGPDEAIL